MNRDDKKARHDELRERAEAKIDSKFNTLGETAGEDVPRLLYELHTHHNTVDSFD